MNTLHGRFAGILWAAIVFFRAFTLMAGVVKDIPYADFEKNPPIFLGGEGVQPESHVDQVTAPVHSGGHAAGLHYVFRRGVVPRQYVELRIVRPMSGKVRGISFWLRGDGSNQELKARLTDASGEVFQYRWGLIDWRNWRRMHIDLTKPPEVSWGGNKDHKIDTPTRSFAILIDSPVEPFDSTVFVDDVTYEAEGDARDFLQMDCRAPVLANAFYGRHPSFEIRLHNPLPSPMEALSLDIRVLDTDDRLLHTQTETLSLGAGASRSLRVVPELADYGLYRLALQFGNRREKFSFSWLPGAAPRKADPASSFGVSMHFGHGGRGPLEKNLPLASDLGMRWLRDDGSWGGIERSKGVYTVPPTFDRFLRQARSDYGCEPLIILDYGNALYENGRAISTEEGRRAFAAWSEYMARTYRDSVRYWEVWNEPNITGFWKPKPNAADYAKLLKATYAAVKRGNPDAVVVAMVTAGIDLGFIERVLKEDTVGFFDAVSVHPYRYPRAPEKGDPTMLEHLHQLVALLARYGAAGTPIYNTEVGWPNQDDRRGLPEQTSADYLSRMYIQLHEIPDIKATFWYDFQNDGMKREYNEHNFGILNHDFTPKAPAVAYRMTSMMLAGTRFQGARDTGDANVRAYEFKDDRERHTLAVWSIDGGGCVATRWPNARDIRRVSAAGPSGPAQMQHGVCVMETSSTPVFFRGKGPIEILPAALRLTPLGLVPGHGGEMTLEARNIWGTRVTGSLAITMPEGWTVEGGKHLSLAAGETVRRRFTVSAGLKVAPGKSYPLAVRWTEANGNLLGLASVLVAVSPAAVLRLEPVRTAAGCAVVVSGETRLDPAPAITSLTITGMEPWGGVSPRVVQGGLRWRQEGKTSAEKGGAWRLRVPVTCPPRAADGAQVHLRVEMVLADGNRVTTERDVIFLQPRKRTIAVDGRLADWEGVPAISLTAFDGVHKKEYGGGEDCSATLRLAWNKVGLCLWVEVTDDEHQQPFHGEKVWEGDGIQLAVAAPGERKKGGSYREIGLSLTDSGPEVYSWTGEKGLVQKAQCHIERRGTTTLYEAVIPWSALGVKMPKKGETLGFALIVNDNDGGVRQGWLHLADGIGWSKNPSLFETLFF